MTQDLRQRFAETNMASKEITNEEMQTDDNIQHPASAATYWVSKWVDYSDKYGIGKSLLCFMLERRTISNYRL